MHLSPARQEGKKLINFTAGMERELSWQLEKVNSFPYRLLGLFFSEPSLSLLFCLYLVTSFVVFLLWLVSFVVLALILKVANVSLYILYFSAWPHFAAWFVVLLTKLVFVFWRVIDFNLCCSKTCRLHFVVLNDFRSIVRIISFYASFAATFIGAGHDLLWLFFLWECVPILIISVRFWVCDCTLKCSTVKLMKIALLFAFPFSKVQRMLKQWTTQTVIYISTHLEQFEQTFWFMYLTLSVPNRIQRTFPEVVHQSLILELPVWFLPQSAYVQCLTSDNNLWPNIHKRPTGTKGSGLRSRLQDSPYKNVEREPIKGQPGEKEYEKSCTVLSLQCPFDSDQKGKFSQTFQTEKNVTVELLISLIQDTDRW